MISKLYFWMIFNQYSRIEEDRGTVNRGERGREAGTIWGRKAGAEIKMVLVCCSLLSTIQAIFFD